MELEAIQYCKKHANKKIIYFGNDKEWKDSIGTVEILEDMNCCCPTTQILFAFIVNDKRKVMHDKEFIEFIKDCKSIT